jgi:ornithine carbamoyltransferase
MAKFFNQSRQQFSPREKLLSNYHTSRINLLLVAILTLINVTMILLGQDSYFLFSACVPYIIALTGAIFCGTLPEEYYEQIEGYYQVFESSAIYGVIKTFEDLEDGISGCDAVFVSAGDNLGDDYYITEAIMEDASPNAIFLHPMPVNRETEAEAAVADGNQSAMLNMAENLLHIEKAVLALTIGKTVNG